MDIGLRPGTDFVVQQRPRRTAKIRDDFRLPRCARIRLAQLRAVKQDKKHKLSQVMNLLAIVGLVYLVGFAGVIYTELCRDIGLRLNVRNKKSPLSAGIFSNLLTNIAYPANDF